MQTREALAKLYSLSQPFRKTYLHYEQLQTQLHSWAEAFPHLVKLTAIGESLAGRKLWVAAIGPSPERRRPSVWVDGNMHAAELCGSSVALGIAEDVLRLHLGGETDLPGPVRARLLEVLLYVAPRLSPDGAEVVLTEGRYVRSNPRDRRPNRGRPRWVSGDNDGDGLSLLMRKEDPSGEFVASSEAPGLMLPRRIEDEGPFYKIYPEGLIEPWDGSSVPDPYFLSDNDTDLNRNFPWSWMPEPEQAGAGAYPTSEPESRAVVEFFTQRPEIFAWLNLHTFGGVYIRPSGHASDKKMNQDDLALFRQIAAWGEEFGKYPTVSGFEEFTYAPDKPLHGDLTDFGYHQRGCIAYVCELWDLFREIGLAPKKPFIENYTHLGREDLIQMARWDQEKNSSRVLRPWRPAQHPQLGAVEVGGLDPRVGIINPPYERIAEICAQQSAAFVRVVSLAPRVMLSQKSVRSLGEGTYQVELTLSNQGYLPTYILSSSLPLPWNEPLWVEARGEGGASLPEGDGRREVGHLEGWGRGLFHSSSAIFYQRSRGSVSQKTLRFTVSGKGVLHLRVGSCRVGFFEERVEVG